MKIGDLVKWVEYSEIQYVPTWKKRIGIVVKTTGSLAQDDSVHVIAESGDLFILSENNETLEILSGSR